MQASPGLVAQGTCVGFRFLPPSGPLWEATHKCFCLFPSLLFLHLSLSPALPLSLKSKRTSSGEGKKREKEGKNKTKRAGHKACYLARNSMCMKVRLERRCVILVAFSPDNFYSFAFLYFAS